MCRGLFSVSFGSSTLELYLEEKSEVGLEKTAGFSQQRSPLCQAQEPRLKALTE